MLPENLIEIAVSLERQFGLSKRRSCSIPLADWKSLPANIRDLIPSWLKELLATHSLVGPVLERPHESLEDCVRIFRFWEPATYAKRITLDDPVARKRNDTFFSEQLIAAGYITISDESDGNMWVTPIKGDPTSPVYLHDLSAREIKEMSKDLADFLASCRISDEY